MNKYLLFLFLGILSCETEQADNYDIIISNVNLINGVGLEIQPNSNVYIKNGEILKIDSANIGFGNKVIDGSNKYLIPGLFDCHVHTNDYKYDFPRLIHFGVTSIFVPGGSTCTNDYYAKMRTLGETDSFPAPRVFHTSQHFTMKGSHPVRTYSSSNWVEGKTVFFLKDTLQIESLVREVAQYPIQGIKLTIEEGPMPPPVPRMPQLLIDKVVAEAQKNNLEVFAHVSDNVELDMALKAGINNLLHFTGVDLDFEKDKDLVSLIYKSDVSWVTTLMIDKSFLYPLHPEWVNETDIKSIYNPRKIGEFTNPVEIQRASNYLSFFKTVYRIDNPTLKNIVSFQVEDIKTLYENGVNMVLGTDTGNKYNFHGHSLHEEMQLLELGGMEPIDIIKMGTFNAAKMLNIQDDLGSIEVGKIADMILLEKNPLESISNTLSINLVIKNGVVKERITNSN